MDITVRSRYDNNMTSTDVAPVLSGEAITPTAISEPHSFSAHGFFNVLRDFAKSGVVYHTEQAVHDALDAIDKYETHVVPRGDRNMVISETDPAGREDVSKRRGAQPLSAAPAGEPIDYAKLAAYIVAAQKADAEKQAVSAVTVSKDDDQ